MKAKQMQAQYDAQNKRSIKHSSTRRGMLAGLAAAAAVLVCGAVTTGAVNDWNYAAVFSKYFSDRSGEPVYYDFTGMGMDIGQEIEGDGFTMTIQSVVADSNALYVAYDVALSDEIIAQLAAYDDVYVNSFPLIDIVQPNDDGTYAWFNRGGEHCRRYQTDDHVWHYMDIKEFDFGTELTDKQLMISFVPNEAAVSVSYDVPAPGEDGVAEYMELFAPEELYTYDLTDIIVQSGIEVAYQDTLPYDKHENIFETLQVTPFGLHFIHNDHWVVDKTSERIHANIDWTVPIVFTAVYADGTERELMICNDNTGFLASKSLNQEIGGYDVYMRADFYFAMPLELDDLTAIRMNDTVIPVQ